MSNSSLLILAAPIIIGSLTGIFLALRGERHEPLTDEPSVPVSAPSAAASRPQTSGRVQKLLGLAASPESQS